MKFNNTINAQMIVIKDNLASTYYANYTKKSWESFGIKVNFFDAVTPQKLSKIKEINFSKYSSSSKYTSRKIKKIITDTEKACWYSHYLLWEKCYFSKEPLLILEHDAILIYPENLWFDDSYGIIFFDAAAMGSYIITPKFAEELLISARTAKISLGPYGFISRFNDVVNSSHKKFKVASDQVMSKKYGNTVDHYEGLNPNEFIHHKFIIID